MGEAVYSRDKTNLPISKDDIQVTPDFIHIIVHTEKKGHIRKVIVSRSNEPWLTEEIIEYKNLFPQEQTFLFPYSTRWAENVYRKYFPNYNIHSLRKWRATHLLIGDATEGNPVPVQVVRRMGGWQKVDTLIQFYDFTQTKDYEHLFIKKKEEEKHG